MSGKRHELVSVGMFLTFFLTGSLLYAQLWPSRHHDPVNSSSTTVELSDSLEPWWTGPTCNNQPIVFDANVTGLWCSCTVANQYVLDAWSGAVLLTLPHSVREAAVSEESDILLTWDGGAFFAYDLLNGQFTQVASFALGFGNEARITPRASDFFILGRGGDVYPLAARISSWRDNNGLASARAEWVWRGADAGLSVFTTRYGAASGSRFYLSLLGGLGRIGGVAALDTNTGRLVWSDLAANRMAGGVSVDEAGGRVFAALQDTVQISKQKSYNVYYVRVYDNAEPPHTLRDLPTDRLCFGPPAFGTVGATPAFFVATGGGSVYAWNRDNLDELLWSCAFPISSLAPPAYAGGKLYVTADNGQLRVLDAATGTLLRTYDAGGLWGGSEMPAIARVPDADNYALRSVICFRGSDLRMRVWGAPNEGPPPPPPPVPYVLQISAAPNLVPLGSTSHITATLTQGGAAVSGAQISFSCSAGRNQGFVAPLSALTDVNGQAVTTYFSGSRTGVVTVTASCPLTDPVSVAIEVIK